MSSGAARWRAARAHLPLLASPPCLAASTCLSVGLPPPEHRGAEKLQGGRGLEAGRAQDAAPRGNWWDPYADPDLDALMRQVAVSNQSVRLAAARYEQAVALLGNARSGYFPPSPRRSPPRAARTPSRSVVVARHHFRQRGGGGQSTTTRIGRALP